jgi:hypothetical protein
VTMASGDRSGGIPPNGPQRNGGSDEGRASTFRDLPGAEPAIRTAETPAVHESFVLTLSVDEPGHVQRSTIRHTRTGIEDTMPGWSPAQLTTFVARHAGLTAGAAHTAETTRPWATPAVGPPSLGDPAPVRPAVARSPAAAGPPLDAAKATG